MARQIKVIHKKVEAGTYEVFINEEKVGVVFKEWRGKNPYSPSVGTYCWSHSKVPDRDIVEGNGAWKTRRNATINLLIEHFFGKDPDQKRVFEALYNG